MANNDRNTALVPAPGPAVIEMRQDFAALHALKSALMRRGTDYGTIPGCGSKAALLKPGAEKVLKRFMVHVVEIPVEDLSTADCIRYRVRCVGQTPDGVTRGVGIGECSSDEEKYRWRKARNNAEFSDTPDARRRVKHMTGKNGDYTVDQVRTNPADQANTVLKMGKKRALVDLALTATAASEFFTQDLDDMDPEMQAQVAAERGARQDPFAPPVDTTAETVDDLEPDEDPAKRQVWEVAKEHGLTGDDVKVVLKELHVLVDSRQWTVKDMEQICNALRARAVGPAGGAGGPYSQTVKLAAEMGATDKDLAAAIVETGHVDTPAADWTDTTCDEVLTALERSKGA